MAEEPWEPYSRNASDFDDMVDAEKLPDEFLELRERFLEVLGDGRILDAGCGTGRDTEYFIQQGFEATGVDIAEGVIEHAEENREGTFRLMDLRDLEFEDSSFDGVWESASMIFMDQENMKNVFSEFSRVLRNRGILFANFKKGNGEKKKEIWGEEVVEHHVPRERTKELLEDNGFNILEVTENTSKSRDNTFVNFLCEKNG